MMEMMNSGGAPSREVIEEEPVIGDLHKEGTWDVAKGVEEDVVDYLLP